MSKVIPIGQPVNDAERAAIAHLRDRLPDTYTLLHNFEIERQGELFEIDLALLTSHALYLIDVKGTRGAIEVHGSKWYPDGRAPFPSPVAKLRSHARTVKGLITQAHPGRRELEEVYVEAAVLLTAPDAFLSDGDGRDEPYVVRLKDAERYFKDATRVPVRFTKDILTHERLILHALRVAKPAKGIPRFGHWQVKERLGASNFFTEYRAENAFAGGTARLRVYQADPYQPEDVRKAQVNRIANAYKALSKLPLHPNIVAARDFFSMEDDKSFVLILEDVSGQALTVHMAHPQLALTLDQKWRVAKDLLAALSHAHTHGAIHRNLTPGAILIGQDGCTRLTDFDFAKPIAERSQTIAAEIVDLVEKAYVAPEAYREPGAAVAESDVFSAGVILYELFTGEKPFAGEPTTVWDRAGEFLNAPSQLRPELNGNVDAWLQAMCTFEAGQRPSAAVALASLTALLQPHPVVPAPPPQLEPSTPTAVDDGVDFSNLPAGYMLTHKFVVEKRLGRGSFGVVYKVIDTLGDVARTVKLIVSDRNSTLERLKKEYRHLLQIPEHPHVVRVLDADVIPGRDIPFLLFEYVEGADVGDMIHNRLFSPEDALELAKQVVDGLVHLHGNGFHHCDIKPRNLLWTQKGAKIIDFNVSVRADDKESRGGGSRRYLPPDFDPESVPQTGERADRDLFALGLTVYEMLTGRYPWETSEPPLNTPARDPREFSGYGDLAPELVNVVLKAIAPRRAERYRSAQELKEAFAEVRHARRIQIVSVSAIALASSGAASVAQVPPNTNPFVSHLQTLYSQSRRSNAGTRGMDALGFSAYVDTALDRQLLPAVLGGEFRLVLISGNAGDGKTAFLQRLEREVLARGGDVDRSLANGSIMKLADRRFVINYDGSQDEGNKDNGAVLREFLASFKGSDATVWQPADTRLIAINEGRLVDFLSTNESEFSALTGLVRRAFTTGDVESGVAVVNLNLRSVVAQADGGSILDRTVQAMVRPEYWTVCERCDLKDRCYALHNARSFQDETAGPRLLDRLKTLYTMVHLRGRLHITMRDLRSALSFMLIGNRDCAEIHELYGAGSHLEVARSYYFNSWMGGDNPNADRLISQLRELDVGRLEDPRFDRGLDFVQPDDRALFRFELRSGYEFEVLNRLFGDLPRGMSNSTLHHRAKKHRDYVAMARRKQFFERRDNSWERMLPYRSAKRMVDVVRDTAALDVSTKALTQELLHAINRGEGLHRPERLGGSLALQLRQVDHGTVRSYRLFPLDRFSLRMQDFAAHARFMEHLPTGLVLLFTPYARGAMTSELVINLDVFEMLTRLNEGYRPSVEEMQGFYLCLGVFKNSLNAQPYSEILLTTTGHDFYRMARQDNGTVELRLLPTANEGPDLSGAKASVLVRGS